VNVYDIDNSFSLVNTITLPTTVKAIRGLFADSTGTHLYIPNYGTTNVGNNTQGRLLSYNLSTNQVDYDQSYTTLAAIDRACLSADNKTIYAPSGENVQTGAFASTWYIINAATGVTTGTGTGAVVLASGAVRPHNTVCGPSKIYMAAVDVHGGAAAHHSVTMYKPVGGAQTTVCCFTAGDGRVRPFAVDIPHDLVYVNLEDWIGFAVGDGSTGAVLYDSQAPPGYIQPGTTNVVNSHGIVVTPDGNNLYVADPNMGAGSSTGCGVWHWDVSGVRNGNPPVFMAGGDANGIISLPCEPNVYGGLTPGWLNATNDSQYIITETGEIIATSGPNTDTIVDQLPDPNQTDGQGAFMRTRYMAEIDTVTGGAGPVAGNVSLRMAAAPPPPITLPPVNTTAPVISGTPTVGSTITSTKGVWSNSPTSYTYQWKRNSANLAGATASTYTTVSADGGTSLTDVVTATNANGSASATSNALSIATAGSTCPKGTGFPNDGCAAAPAPLTASFYQPNAFQPGGFFNATAATTANYMATNCGPGANQLCRPPWNVAGVDYAIGPYMTNLIDPATLTAGNTKIPGCVYDTTSTNTGAGELVCGGSSFQGTVQGVEFGPIGGHGCTALRANAPASGVTTFTLDNVHLRNDNGLCSGAYNTSFWAYFSFTYPNGVTITNSDLDGGADVWDNPWGGISTGAYAGHCTGLPDSPTSTAKCNPSNMIGFGNNGATIRYSYLHNWAGTIATPYPVGRPIIMEFDVVRTWCVRTPNCHSEWWSGPNGGGAGLLQFDYMTVMGDGNENGPANSGPAPMQTMAGWGQVVTDWEFHHVVQIDPFTGGYGATDGTVTGCFGAPPTGGTATNPTCPSSGAPGNVFFVTAYTGAPYKHGINIVSVTGGAQCAGSAGSGVGGYKHIAGPYSGLVIDEWGMDAQSTNGSKSSWYPNYINYGSCIGGVVHAKVGNNSAVFGGHWPGTPLVTSNITDNYLDISSYAGSTPQAWNLSGPEGSAISISGSITGTTLTVSSGTPSAKMTIQGPGITTSLGNCATTLSSCPKIVSGANPTWTLDLSVGTPVSGISMSAWKLYWCTNKTNFSNNINMTGESIMHSSWLNQWSSIGTNTFGCS
jgi:hypothetical protein